jgi:hypothetical protein
MYSIKKAPEEDRVETFKKNTLGKNLIALVTYWRVCLQKLFQPCYIAFIANFT